MLSSSRCRRAGNSSSWNLHGGQLRSTGILKPSRWNSGAPPGVSSATSGQQASHFFPPNQTGHVRSKRAGAFRAR